MPANSFTVFQRISKLSFSMILWIWTRFLVPREAKQPNSTNLDPPPRSSFSKQKQHPYTQFNCNLFTPTDKLPTCICTLYMFVIIDDEWQYLTTNEPRYHHKANLQQFSILVEIFKNFPLQCSLLHQHKTHYRVVFNCSSYFKGQHSNIPQRWTEISLISHVRYFAFWNVP